MKKGDYVRGDNREGIFVKNIGGNICIIETSNPDYGWSAGNNSHLRIEEDYIPSLSGKYYAIPLERLELVKSAPDTDIFNNKESYLFPPISQL